MGGDANICLISKGINISTIPTRQVGRAVSESGVVTVIRKVQPKALEYQNSEEKRYNEFMLQFFNRKTTEEPALSDGFDELFDV